MERALPARAADQLPGPLTRLDVARLQRAGGNRAVARVLADAPPPPRRTPARDAVAPSSGVLQRLKKGDFKELEHFGLDVGTWIEFADAVKALSHGSLTMALRLLELREATNPDAIRAKLLVDKQRYRLRKPPRSLVEHWFGSEETDEKAKEPPKPQHGVKEVDDGSPDVGGPRALIGDNITETTLVRSTSDLLVWLVSHPTGQAKSPRDFSNSQTLARVLRILDEMGGLIDPPKVWDVLRQVKPLPAAKAQDSDEEDEAESKDDWDVTDVRDEHEGADVPWRGKWRTKGDTWGENNETKPIDAQEFERRHEVPAEFRRVMPSHQYDAALAVLRTRLAGHKLVGVHATTMDNVGPLIVEGVSNKRIGSGHGQGKGEGFYIIPTPSGAKDIGKAERSAKQAWGLSLVAVYLPNDCVCKPARKGDNVQTLEQAKGDKRFYYLFGGEEAVIPPALFDEIILARDPADIAVADPGLPWQQTTKSAVSFVTKL